MTVKSDPYWWDDAGPPANYSDSEVPKQMDVVVVGAGLTGLTAALTLSKAGKSVLVLDARRPGEGASSRNGGMIGGGHRLTFETMSTRFGRETALGLLREAHLESGEFVRTLMHNEAIDCDYAETGRFRGYWRTSEYEAGGRDLDRLKKLIPLQAEMLPRENQRSEVATDIYRGGTLFYRHGGFNPAKWVAGIGQASARAGAVILGNTPVHAVERSGSEFSISSARGQIRAGSVLAATNGYTSGPFTSQRRRIVPIPSFLIATEELGRERLQELIPNARMIAESRERHCYYRPSCDGTRLVFGARAAMFDAPQALVISQMRGLVRQVFPQLGSVEFSHCWRGFTGFSFDFLPNVGQIDGIWHAMGYSGSGNAMAPYLGHKVALQILGDPEGNTAFSRTGFPLRWWHRGKPWFLPFADLAFRARDAWNLIRS